MLRCEPREAEYVEGDILLLRDGSKWIVKGCTHPSYGVIAVPRVVGNMKIKTLSKALNIIRRWYYHLLRFIPEVGRKVPVVSKDLIYRHLKPLRDGVPGSTYVKGPRELVRAAFELITLLKNRCGLKCGVTGGLLGGYAGRGSDIDLICLDYNNSFECLSKLRLEGLLLPISYEAFISEACSVKELMNEDYLILLAGSRLTQGLFKGFKYTLRMVNCCREKGVRGPYVYSYRTHLLLRILSSDYRTPSIYEAELLKPVHSTLKLITYRVRLTELPVNTIIDAEGNIYIREDGVRVVSLDTASSRIYYIRLPQ